MTDVIDARQGGGGGWWAWPGEVGARVGGRAVGPGRGRGVSLVGPGGLLPGLTKTVLETGLEAEMTEHVGYEPYDPAGHHSGNSRNGTRTKTVITDIGPVEIEVPRDRAGTFEPVIVPKRRRRLGGVDQMVLSLSAKGLTHGEISAHLGGDLRGQGVQGDGDADHRRGDRDHGRVAEPAAGRGVPGGVHRRHPRQDPRGPGGQPADLRGRRRDRRRRPGHLGLWVGEGGEGAKYWAARVDRDQEPGHQGRVHLGVRRPDGPARRGEHGVAAGDRAEPALCI